MPSVLITRPLVAAEPLAAELGRLGYQTVVEPLLSIMPLDTPFPQMGTIDAVIITSSNALPVLESKRDQISGLFGVPCFCVGLRTAEKASAFGFRHVQSAAGDGARLLQLIGNVIDEKKISMLHIAGRDIDGRIRQELEKMGHRVAMWPVYEAVPVPALSTAILRLLKEEKLDAIAVFSPRTARILRELLSNAALEACCAGLTAICLSEAVVAVLKPLKWRRLVAAPQPTENAVIACLQEACPVQS